MDTFDYHGKFIIRSFSAHSSNRDNTGDITEDRLNSDIDLIRGAQNGVATRSDAEKNGFTEEEFPFEAAS